VDFGKVLTRAWEITWRWKVLWILGFLASLGCGGGGGGGGGSSYSEDASSWGKTYHTPYIPPEVIALIVGAMCLGIIVIIAIWVVSVIARGGLIAGVQQVEEEDSTTFGQAWRVGVSRFWTMFGIGILASVPFIILLIVGFVVLVVMLTGSGLAIDSSGAIGGLGIVLSLLCGGAFCCGMIILGIILAQVRLYAERAAVLEGLGWIEAFKRGWEVLKENLGSTIILWLIFLAIGLVLGVIVFSIVMALLLPIIALVTNIDPGPWMIMPACCGGLLAIVVGALLSAIITTFTSATWTLAYREMIGLGAAPAAAAPLPEAVAEV
jgi:hypothetical protein